ncbi:SDR family NAD(P)-dependent oxidoreductase [Nonomuraea sp. NPDC048826]|uniref:SDR family NAD(P)-dependent oxidoreductase n=1 Tax=Nonomuraea sp. NPDC048826 TaxID=3364347 RepID=UPI00371E8F28
MSARVAVVTGGASGMGLAVAAELSARGHRVASLDLDETPGDGLGLRVDVTDRGAVDRALATVRAELGPVGIVVTSAGLAPFTDFTAITPEVWQKVLAVNLTGTFNVIQAAIPDMVAASWGRVVTISSAAGQNGSPRQAHYAASKGGVIALTKALSWDYARLGITANSIAPGPVDTPMARRARDDGNMPDNETLGSFVPVGRVGTVEEIAAACAYLCSEAAGYVTGQVLGVNGGLVL